MNVIFGVGLIKNLSVVTKSNNTQPKEKIYLYDILIGRHPDIVRKGKTMPYLQ